ncbi:SdiA-regulated domain-containing protein [Pseudomonas parafulva]|uniref:SdiA-regulated domain-containing protein n=1 Tax=Pseudomonas parafulva TaxID=157782 RepID=UPI0005408628|nr:SdiA-regulated domain-containing protein [Pseudomonas parafulva]AIZ34775.1 DNA-binding protein [Pseudomonas parafulva]
MPAASHASARRKRPFYRRWSFAFAAMAVIAYGVAIAMHWDDRAVLWIKERFESKAERQQSVWLPDYRVDIDAKHLPGMADDEASDLSFNPQTRTLFAVMGKNPFLVELTLEGDVLRQIPLLGWANPEGVAVLDNGQIAIVDERNHDLTVVKVDPGTTSLTRADFPNYDLGESEERNKGFEAIAWDPKRQRLVIGEERPPRLYTWNTDGRGPLVGSKQPLPNDQLDLRNLSALAVDPRSGHLLVLSADSHLLLELDEKGQQVSFISLLGAFNGLKSRIPRAEGVTMDDQGNLYIISEPALFYRFKKS